MYLKKIMKNQFLKYCSSIGIEKSSKILLAVSGGLDSMALLQLFHGTGFLIEVAHCNFNLRADASDKDALMVQGVCQELGLVCHIKEFATKEYSENNKISIQMAARDLRYEWFEALRLERQLDYIATAHHQDDQVETLLINLTRGTGIKGLKGIQPISNLLIRPLLFCDRPKLEKWMQSHEYLFREDQSNHSLLYLRNKIRHQVLPILRKINPSISKTFHQNAERISCSEENLSFFYEQQRKKVIQIRGDQICLILPELYKFPSPMAAIFYFISGFGFSDWSAVSHLLTAQSGKIILSSSHQLLKDRDCLIIRENIKQHFKKYFIDQSITSIVDPRKIHFQTIDIAHFEMSSSPNQAALDFHKLVFPLVLRKWNKGDLFRPLGMKRDKKLSDFFIDQKLSLFEKENVLLLCSLEQIVWVIGHRIDERFKLVKNSQKVYLVRIN